eukprot:5718397-Pyramimonas_sp.AAC.1
MSSLECILIFAPYPPPPTEAISEGSPVQIRGQKGGGRYPEPDATPIGRASLLTPTHPACWPPCTPDTPSPCSRDAANCQALDGEDPIGIAPTKGGDKEWEDADEEEKDEEEEEEEDSRKERRR